MPDIELDPRLSDRLRELLARAELRSYLSATISLSGQSFGLFAVAFRAPRAFGDRELRLLTALGQRAAVAIQNARLYEHAQHAAALEERQRLARELHDAVTQTLFSASLIGDVLPQLLARNPAEARRRVEELRRLTRGALAEMRALLLELRPTVLTDIDLSRLLRQLAEAVASRVPVEVSVETLGQRSLPPEVQVGLYRLAQEALNNVAKHAQAQHVWVCLAHQADGLELHVRDDGRGFDQAAVPAGHFGLSMMRERAEAIGATLQVHSRRGEGTQVTVAWRDPDC